LLLTDSGPVVVDVKPRHRLVKPEVSMALGWTRAVVESRGWCYEVFSEPPQPELANVRFLAGYRRAWLFDQDLLEELREVDRMSVSLPAQFRRRAVELARRGSTVGWSEVGLAGAPLSSR
jgi:hypothetical protein